jgi:hypothetical protein
MITVTEARTGMSHCHSEPSGAGAGGSTGRRAKNLGLPFARRSFATSTSQQRNKEQA